MNARYVDVHIMLTPQLAKLVEVISQETHQSKSFLLRSLVEDSLERRGYKIDSGAKGRNLWHSKENPNASTAALMQRVPHPKELGW